MPVANFASVLYFAATGGRELTMAEFARRYRLRPDGRLTYVGLTAGCAERFAETGRVLAAHHRAVADDVLAALGGTDVAEAALAVALEPTQVPRPFGFVAEREAMIEALAAELQSYAAAARALGKRLAVTVRYASEMNARGGAPYAGDPETFVASFRAVRAAFARVAPDVRFAFSPAIRADLEPGAAFARYWPGDDAVDVCGGTWYVHGETQRARAFEHLRRHVAAGAARGKPLGLDEIGGAEGHGSGGPGSLYERNDRMLALMLAYAGAFEELGIAFAYGTLFLDERKYGTDATLAFLSSDSA